jgi:isoquinoline 1-oxidoreductase alpha subunit
MVMLGFQAPYPMPNITINQQQYFVTAPLDTPLLWVLRDELGFTGTKYGCGIAVCGVCSVLLDGVVTRSCVTPLSAALHKNITTIEGLSSDNSHPLQQAWIEEQVPQCGYCQSGQLINALALLQHSPQPTDTEIDTAMAQVLCRCGTYQRIRQAIRRAAQSNSEATGNGQ